MVTIADEQAAKKLRRRLRDAEKRLSLEELHTQKLEQELTCLRNIFVSAFSPTASDGTPFWPVRAGVVTISVVWARVMQHGDAALMFLVAKDGAMHNYGFLLSCTQVCVFEDSACKTQVVNLACMLSCSNMSLVFDDHAHAEAFLRDVYAT
jgi:hypothetical protein